MADEKVTTAFDVVVIGAGISGINSAYRLQTETPDISYTILEARHDLGGTWDLFRYPGLRSDSDLHTFGFEWRPWADPQTIADGRAIKNYMKECAEVTGIDKKIRYHHCLEAADWSSETQSWTLTVRNGETTKHFSAKFLLLSTGYYDYKKVLEAKIPGIENFKGKVIHPQFWPGDLDYTGKKIAIIGSGATAITLLPNLTDKAAHVTMVQRSPTYIISLPQEDGLGKFAHRWFPSWFAYRLVRLKFLVLPTLFFNFCRAFPNLAKKVVLKGTSDQLPGRSLDPDFVPKYNPWEQRLCVCPDGDFYNCIKKGTASVVTGNIKNIDASTITMQESGQVLEPDIIVTATGLKVRLAGGCQFSVDKKPYTINDKFLWRTAMVQDLPNAATIIGYTNASWTLGADVVAYQVIRMLKLMKQKGFGVVIPRVTKEEAAGMKALPPFNLNSTYLEKAKGDVPSSGDSGPWRQRRSYFADLWQARYGSLTAGLEYVPQVST